MPSKEQPYSNDKISSKQRSPKPTTGNLNVARQQTHPATLIQRAKLDPRSLTPRDVLQLQRTIGNQAVGRLLLDTVQRQENFGRRKVEAKGKVEVSGEAVGVSGKNMSIHRQNLSKAHPAAVWPVQRYTEEEIKTSAYHEWEKAGKKQNLSVEQMKKFWDKGIQGLIAHHIWKYKDGGGQEQTKEDAKKDFEAAGEIWAAAKQKGLPVDWITESYIKTAFEEETVDDGKNYAIEWITDTLLPIHQHLESQQDVNGAKAVKQYLLSHDFNFNSDLIEEVFLKSEITQSTAAPGAGVKIDGVQFLAANPVIIKKDPEIEKYGIYFPQFKKVPTTSVSKSGSFAILASIQIKITFPSGTNLSGWEVGIIQNVKSDRQAKYNNGKKFARVTDNWMMDAVDPPWIKNNNQSIGGLASGDSVQIFMSDSPSWAAPDKINSSPRTSFTVKDEFRAFIVVKKGSGEYKPLFKQEWQFTSDGKSATYKPTGEQRLTTGASSELITAKAPKAYDIKDTYG